MLSGGDVIRTAIRLTMLSLRPKPADMKMRLLLATTCQIGLALLWYVNYVPTWVAILSAGSLVIWGLNLDWRRNKREADVRMRTKERQRRRAERELTAREERLKNR